MDSLKVSLFIIFTLLSLSFAYGDFGSLKYKIKREVPSGTNHEESPLTSPLEEAIVSNDFGSLNYEIKHEVPSGPNPEEPPLPPSLEEAIVSRKLLRYGMKK